MRVLIDIGHPAHVHMFSQFGLEMQQRGHKVLFTCRDKEFEKLLLRHYNLPFIDFGKKHRSVCGKLWDLIRFDLRELWTAIKFHPDVLVSHGSITASHVAWLIRKPHIPFEDTFNMEQVRLYLPFSKTIITSNYANPLQGDKIIRYPGYKELLSLHPNRFTPDQSILEELGVVDSKGSCVTTQGMRYQPYVIVRFVGWNATHDRGHHGISLENKIKAIQSFSQYARVIISSEGQLPDELEPYRAKINPARMHDAEAFASLIFGESSTMVAEGAVLGVPGVFLDNTGRLFTKQLEDDYQLCFNLTESEEDQLRAIQIGLSILQDPSSQQIYQQRRQRMLADKIDVTAWFVWLIENYPSSAQQCADSNFDWSRYR